MKETIIFFICFLSCCQIGKSQTSYCDTLFLSAGDTILISINHKTFRNKILYENCLNKRSRQSVKKSAVLKISKNSVYLNTKTPKRNYVSKITLLNDKVHRGRLYAVDSNSILLLKEGKDLKKYSVSEMKYAKFHKKEVKTVYTITGALIGGILGAVVMTADVNSRADAGTGISGFFAGSAAGAILGNYLGSIGIKVDINENRNNYQEGINKLKFY